MTFSRRLLQRIGVDRTVGYALVARGWTAVSGLLGLAVLTRFLSPAEQGYYYTFNSVLGFTLLLEMGLTYVILQVASHERAGLEWTAGGVLEGDPVAKARLASLLRLSLLWYGCLAVLMVGIVLPTGLLFFSRHTPIGAHLIWQWPWAGVVIASAGILALSPILALIEGLGRVAAVTQTQMFQSLAGSLVFWLALFLHCGLFAAAIFNAAILLFQAVWLWRRQGPFLRDLLRAARPGVRIGWRDEIWPFQWKIAVSSISGLFVFLFNPLMLAAHGAAQAGRLGLSLTVMGAITLIGLSWVTTKSAPFGTLIARGDWRELDRRFFPCLWQSWAVVALGGTAFWTAAFVLHQLHHRLAGRMLAPLPLALLVGTALINHVISSQALYLRAHKQDPFLPLSLTVGALVALSSVLVVRPYGATGLMLGYFLVYLLVGLGGGTWLFVRARRRWHRDSPPVPRPPAPLAATGAGR